MRSALLVSALALGCGSYKSARSPMAAEYVTAGSPMAYEPSPSSEDYTDYGKNPWVAAAEDRFSTFAADVDTASYTIGRRKLQEGTLPPAASVRVEEWVNYFKYSFPAAQQGTPF